MNRKLILYLPYIHEYLQDILKARVDLRGFVLYGSVVSGEITETSDIDMKIFVGNKDDLKLTEEIEERINKKIIQSGLTNLLHSIVSLKADAEHIEGGILLYGKPVEVMAGKEKLTEMDIITYNTTGLDKNKRVSLAIRLFGHEVKKEIKGQVKIYGTEGLVKNYGGKSLRNAIIINTKDSEKISRTLKESGAECESSRIYLSRFVNFVER